MKNLGKLVVAVGVLFSSASALEKIAVKELADTKKSVKTLKSSSKSSTTFKNSGLTVIENGRKRALIDFSNNSSIVANNIKSAKNGVVVRFKDSSSVNIKEFETKYSLKLKTKLRIGYYIFYNKSSNTDATIINSIVAQEKNLDVVKPNWKMNNRIR